MSKQHHPNLFQYATKELSQDAMICWFIKWADDQYATSRENRGLHELGRRFIAALLHQHEAATPTSIDAKIYQQEKGIDTQPARYLTGVPSKPEAG